MAPGNPQQCSLAPFPSRNCPHFESIKGTEKYASYKIILRRICFPRSSKSRARLAPTLRCSVCYDFSYHLHCCFFCTSYGCRSSTDNHLQQHYRDTPDHFLAVGVVSGAIFCFLCQDYVVDRDCINEAQSARQEMEYHLDIIGTDYFVPTEKQLQSLQSNPVRLVLGPDRHFGLRGLLNLGHTCFMSCIIQSLVHTPCLMKYFLAEQHYCPPGSTQSKCLICELTAVFKQFYNGGKEPLSLNRLLYLIWRNKQLLAAYEQQDAHEFFIAILDLIHKRFEETRSEKVVMSSLGIGTASLKKGLLSSLLSSPPHTSVDTSKPLRPKCECVVDAIFGGFLQSDLICPSCNDTSTTIDPFYDISLELPSDELEIGSTEEEIALNRSLERCLSNFTEPEKLGCLMECSSCHRRINGTKQLSLRTCPIVASFQFKRSGYVSRNNRKTSTLVAFPEFLDLRQFMAQSRRISRPSSKDGDNATPSPPEVIEDSTDYTYALYAVVTHIGSGDGGHYICFVRSDNIWFRCDDHHIVETNRAEVFNSECYMLFYHKRTLDYYW